MQADDFNDHRFCWLHRACERGFHSIVEVLLKVDGWSNQQKDSALTGAMHASRLDLVELLLAHGARVAAIDFEDLCRTLNIELMTRFLEAGVDPAADNAFARALDEFKARPLLRFYRDQVEKYPSLKGQISLALAEAVREKKTRWAALLTWVGADPFMTAPEGALSLQRGQKDALHGFLDAIFSLQPAAKAIRRSQPTPPECWCALRQERDSAPSGPLLHCRRRTSRWEG